jgi:integrase/recombinase XerD
LARQVLRIIGKGDKERLVPLPQPVLDDLGCLWRPHHNRRWLFPNRHGDAPINNRVLSRSFAAAAAVAGIRQRATPHALRHGYATRLVENGVNIRVVHILLGHAGIASTAIYTHLTTPTRASLHGLLDWLMTPRAAMIELADVFRRFAEPHLNEPRCPTDFLRRLRAAEALNSFSPRRD